METNINININKNNHYKSLASVRLLLIIGVLIIISSCANLTALKNNYEETYTIKLKYSCPNGYVMARDVNMRTFCVADNIKSVLQQSHLNVSNGRNNGFLAKTNSQTSIKPKKATRLASKRPLNAKKLEKCKG